MRFRVDASDPVAPSHALEEHLKRLFVRVQEASVDIVVLPELSVQAESWDMISELTQGSGLSLVVAGSTHVEAGDPPALYNRIPVLDNRGRQVWTHDKRGRFAIQARHWATMQAQQRAPEFICADSPQVESSGRLHEANQAGHVLHLFDTSLGRIAVLICADALDPMGFRRLVEDTQIDLLLLPSMSFEVGPFFDFAEQLRGARTTTLYVNAGCALVQQAPEQIVTSAFACLPFRGHPGGAPNRVAWDGRTGALYRYRPGQPLDDNQQIAESEAFQRLPDGLGLVVNLGTFWQETPPVNAEVSIK